MTLMGTLDTFGLPEVLQLLGSSRKTGALHLRRQQVQGVVHLQDGAITGARADITRQPLARRLVGAGVVDDDLLADAVAALLDDPACGLAAALGGNRILDAEALRALATEQAVDAVFDLLRWPDGGFEFVTGDSDPDDVGVRTPVEEVVLEVRRRLARWPALTAAVPSPASVVSFAAAAAQETMLSREEWSLLSLVDGSRTVSDLVTLSGRGEYALVESLADLVERHLLSVGQPGSVALMQRQQLLGALESATRIGEPLTAATVPPVSTPVPPAPVLLPGDRDAQAPPSKPSAPEELGPCVPAAAAAPAVLATAQVVGRDSRVSEDLLLRLLVGLKGL